MKEEWRDIKGYEGCYQVSNYGRVKSLSRKFVDSRGRHQNIRERIRKVSNDKDGYKIISLRKKSIRIHRVVAEAFIDNPQNKPQVNHRDGDKINNHVDNLEWCTGKENIHHSWKNGYNSVIHTQGKNHYKTKFSNQDIFNIRNMYLNGMKQRDIAEIYNVSQCTICDIILAKTWKHLGIHRIISNRKGENAVCVKLTEKAVIDIRKNYKKGINKMSDFAYKYNVNVKTISAVISGKNWSHVVVP